MDLDETFPLAQTESSDDHDQIVYEQRAQRVAAWTKRLSPKQVFLVAEGDYGAAIRKELAGATRQLKVIGIRAKGSKPDRTVSLIIQQLL